LVRVFLTQLAIKRPFEFPPHPKFATALPVKNRTIKILHFYSKQYDYLIKITHIKHILARFLSLSLTIYPILQLSNCLQ